MGVIKLQVLSHLSSILIKVKKLPTNGHSVAQCQHSGFTIFLTLRRQMYMDSINLYRNLIRGHSKSTSLVK